MTTYILQRMIPSDVPVSRDASENKKEFTVNNTNEVCLLYMTFLTFSLSFYEKTGIKILLDLLNMEETIAMNTIFTVDVQIILHIRKYNTESHYNTLFMASLLTVSHIYSALKRILTLSIPSSLTLSCNQSSSNS